MLFVICICGLFILLAQNNTECRLDQPSRQRNERKSIFNKRTITKNSEDKDEVGKHRNQRLKCFLFIMILAAPTEKSKERRNAIRKTWLSSIGGLQKEVVAKFVIGTSGMAEQESQRLTQENEELGDLLLLPNLKDSYHNLTMKVLQSFIWINTNTDCSYVFKADDDTFARLDAIVSKLKSVTPGKNLYWGFFRGNAHVKKSGPWAERRWILCDKYLPYAQGGGYVLSSSLVEFIAQNAHMLQLYNSEDVSVGAWLAPVKMTRLHDTHFDTEYKTRGCRNVHIVSHKQSIDDMLDKFEQLQTRDQLCFEETYLRKSFEYDWTVPPSQCCERVSGVP